MAKAVIRDVAEAAGVSTATVSRTLSHPEVVSEKTRRKVMEAAKRLNFQTSRSAMALKQGRSYRIALLINQQLTSWFNASVLMGLNSVLQPAGYDITVYQDIDDAESRRDFFETMPVRGNTDAVIVASFDVERGQIEQLRQNGIPLVGINVPRTEGFDASISIDDVAGMHMATTYLINTGHRRLVYVCSTTIPSMTCSTDLREQGFIRACRENEGSHDLQWQVIHVPRNTEVTNEALSSLLALDEFPDAICCQADMFAVPLLYRLARYGHVAPRDFSMVGFDDGTYAEVMQLTTVRQHPETMGVVAANKVLALINGDHLDHPHETAPIQLMLRGSDSPR